MCPRKRKPKLLIEQQREMKERMRRGGKPRPSDTTNCVGLGRRSTARRAIAGHVGPDELLRHQLKKSIALARKKRRDDV